MYYFNNSRLNDGNHKYILDGFVIDASKTKYVPIYFLDYGMLIFDIDIDNKVAKPKTVPVKYSNMGVSVSNVIGRGSEYLTKHGSEIGAYCLHMKETSIPLKFKPILVSCVDSKLVIDIYSDAVKRILDLDITKQMIDNGIDINKYKGLFESIFYSQLSKIKRSDVRTFHTRDTGLLRHIPSFADTQVTSEDILEICFCYNQFQPFSSFDFPNRIMEEIIENHSMELG